MRVGDRPNGEKDFWARVPKGEGGPKLKWKGSLTPPLYLADRGLTIVTPWRKAVPPSVLALWFVWATLECQHSLQPHVVNIEQAQDRNSVEII